MNRFNSETLGTTDPISLVRQVLKRPEDLPIKVTQIIPRLKDGGAFVKFKHPPQVSPIEVELKLKSVLKSKPVKPWFNPFKRVRVNLVHGVPWLEDLLRFPRNRLKVEFIPADADGTAVELSQEHLYSLFRSYGKIAEISSQPSDSKITPRFAYLDFALTRDAIMARNCLHGLVIGSSQGGGKSGTLLRLSYEDRQKTNWLWSWIKSHPRVVFPIIAAVIAAFTVIIFDPIRILFVKLHIQQTLRLTNSRLYRWFKTQTSDLLSPALSRKHRDKGENLGTVWEHRKDTIKKIKSWLLETAESVIVIQGPKGSGKREMLLEQTLSNKEDVLIIDTKPIVDARGESSIIKKLARAVGYRPVFSWANSMSSMIDLAVQSTTGVKSGLSETLESQIAKILHTTASALRKVALEKRTSEETEQNLSDDAWLEAHPEKRPVVVVDNFLYTTSTGGVAGAGNGEKEEAASILNDKIAEWSAALVQSNVAHVVVLVEDNAAATKTLGKAMPDRSFKTVTLGDLSPDIAKKFILSHLEDVALDQPGDKDMTPGQKRNGEEREGPFGSWLIRRKTVNENENNTEKEAAKATRKRLCSDLEQCIPILGGRLNDLELLARRIRSGQSCRAAVEDIISQSSSDVLKTFIFTKKQETDRKWSPNQAWYLIDRIAAKGSINYNEVILNGRFTGMGVPGTTAEEALDALVAEELISLSRTPSSADARIAAGRPVLIKPGRPVYKAAFDTLASDHALQANMDLKYAKKQLLGLDGSIKKYEEELAVLASVGRSKETQGRIAYLMRKIEKSQKQIEELEMKNSELSKLLRETE